MHHIVRKHTKTPPREGFPDIRNSEKNNHKTREKEDMSTPHRAAADGSTLQEGITAGVGYQGKETRSRTLSSRGIRKSTGFQRGNFVPQPPAKPEQGLSPSKYNKKACKTAKHKNRPDSPALPKRKKREE